MWPGTLRGMFWVQERTYDEAREVLALRLEATAAMLRRGRPKMRKDEQYEKLVFLCEQHDWAKPDTTTRFAITDLVKEIGTTEADLIVSAFEGRHLNREAVRKARSVLIAADASEAKCGASLCCDDPDCPDTDGRIAAQAACEAHGDDVSCALCRHRG